MKVLHAASECFPLAKTGGLADVLAALPPALAELGAEVRVCIPAYRGLPQLLDGLRRLGGMSLYGRDVEVLEGSLSGQSLRFWLVDCPALFDRAGNPYHDQQGRPWTDNALRFGCFSRVVAQLAAGIDGWKPDVLHLHDWQAALAAAWLAQAPTRPRLVYTIHNLAYQGVFGRAEFDALGLPQQMWQPDALEFWGGFSCMKAGLNFGDAITTVSPSYAREIQTSDFGHGLDGALRARGGVLRGILNGIDPHIWNPAIDPALAARYSLRNVVSGKAANKDAMRTELGLPLGKMPLLIFIGRFAEQKGADLMLAARQGLMDLPLQIAVLGTGDRTLEQGFLEWSQAQPARVALALKLDEGMAHRLTAAADLQLMPSRFEPCGLNQMYAQRYGTLPVVRRTGGLADTVVDATPQTLEEGSASGVQFEHADAGGVLYGVRRALELLANKSQCIGLRRAGMTRDFSWRASAQAYLDLYQELSV
jgi:starch synthase